MTVFNHAFAIANPQGAHFQELEGLVDTGSTFTVIPRQILDALGVRPQRKARFSLGNNQIVEYDVGEARIRLAGLEGPTYVVFGAPEADPLIGAVTLEGFLLGVDPVNEALIPVTGELKPVGSSRP